MRVEEDAATSTVAPAAEPVRTQIVSKRKAVAATASAEFPSTALLHAPEAAIAIDEDELRQRARLIEVMTRNMQVSVPTAFETFETIDTVVRTGDFLGKLARSTFDAAAVRSNDQNQRVRTIQTTNPPRV